MGPAASLSPIPVVSSAAWEAFERKGGLHLLRVAGKYEGNGAWSRPDAEARLAAQLPIDEKAARADFVVENTGAPADLGAKADRLLADLRRGLGRKLPNAAAVRY